MAERPPVQDEGIFSLVHGLDESVVASGPAVVLRRIVDDDRRVGKSHVRGHLLRREIHSAGNMLDLGRNVGLDGGEDIAVAHADPQGAAAAHGIPAQIDAVRVDAVLLDHPFDRVDHPFVPWG